MNNFVLECCIDNLESAQNAIRGGATRLEVCANLVIGGTTPSVKLVEQIQQISDIPLRVMIRPRFGDFCYTDSEIEIMIADIKAFAALNVDGVVFGVLQPDGNLHTDHMQKLIQAAPNLKITLHRAFDVTVDPFKALDDAKKLGIDTILTSGQQETSLKGASLLAELQSESGSITLMAGSGVSPDNIAEIRKISGLSAYHLSGRVVDESPMLYRKAGVSMGLPSLSEYERWNCDPQKIATAKQLLEEIN